MVAIQAKLIEYVKMHQLIKQHILAIVYKSMSICKIKNKQNSMLQTQPSKCLLALLDNL
jgi:hypothetical protein